MAQFFDRHTAAMLWATAIFCLTACMDDPLVDVGPSGEPGSFTLTFETDPMEKLKVTRAADNKTDAEKAINLCNSGCMCFDGKTMFELLEAIGNENAAGEYYLTDAVSVARQKGLKCTVVECSPEEVAGANTREELALLESFLNKRKNK